jgi:hypothetical protein
MESYYIDIFKFRKLKLIKLLSIDVKSFNKSAPASDEEISILRYMYFSLAYIFSIFSTKTIGFNVLTNTVFLSHVTLLVIKLIM